MKSQEREWVDSLRTEDHDTYLQCREAAVAAAGRASGAGTIGALVRRVLRERGYDVEGEISWSEIGRAVMPSAPRLGRPAGRPDWWRLHEYGCQGLDVSRWPERPSEWYQGDLPSDTTTWGALAVDCARLLAAYYGV